MAQNIEEFRNSIPVGDLGIIPLQSCSELGNMVNEYIVDCRIPSAPVSVPAKQKAQSLILSEAKIYICLLMSPIIQLNILSAVT